MNIVEERLKRWKEKLIDLSKRNRLLNFRPTKVTTVRIVDEIPSEIYKLVVIDDTSMGFLHILSDEGEENVEKDNGDDHKEKTKKKAGVKSKEFLPYKSDDLKEQHVDKYLQTNLSKEDLRRNLLRIYSKSLSVMEEQGYNALFLALGCLEWYESDNSDVKLKAPLILIPVELMRKSVKGSFKLKYTGEPPMFNPALIQKLKNDFNIKINANEYFDEEIDPQKIFLMVQDIIKDYERWRVINDIYLSLFSFSKFIMYKDFDKQFNTLLDNPILKTICGQSSSGQNVSLGLHEEEKSLDDALKASKTFQILDADSSQQQAILAAKRGKNIVIEGPPGTGKSQTIANIISEFLAEDKKVLFVSQKMAALEVVKKRLDNNGLGDFCMELHSRKTNKNEVIKELIRVLEMQKKPDHSHDDEIATIESIKKELNGYVKAIHTPYGKLEMTPYQTFGIINRHQDISDLSIIFKDVKEWSKHRYNKCRDLLDNLAYTLSKVQNPLDHSWYGSRLTAIYYQDKINVKKLLETIINIYPILQNHLERLKKNYFYNNPATIAEIDTLIDISFLLNRHCRYLKNPFLQLSFSFWKDRGLLKKYIDNPEYGAYIKNFIDKLKNNRRNKKDEKVAIEDYKSLLSTLAKTVESFKDNINKLFKVTKFDDLLIFKTKFTNEKLKDLISKITRMAENIDTLDDWARYQEALQECQKEGLADFVDKLISLDFPLKKFVNAFEYQFLKCWMDGVFSERKALQKFYGEDHEKLIEKFCELDKKQIELTKIRIKHILSGKFDSNYVPSKASELGILRREGRKTRAHISIRKLFETASTVITTLKPCLMMSPLTVAQFINPELIKFDIVIFDEASQIPSEDSVGSISRGKQIVIAGDSKQLPPTTFFQSEVLTPEDEDDASTEALLEDLGSILDECAVSNIPRTMLRWHYRSQHESLIAFSNKNFYNNRLFTFPCANENCSELGLKFHYNPNTVYDRGGKGTNIEEANEVAKVVFKHFKETPELSLGIGTFSIRQKYAIEDAIEQMLKEDNSLEVFFAKDKPEHFFIKNLETIQGDERDVIFISVGYGKNQNGRLPMNFGPINQNGGARRLNVLVTRARKRLEIFSSIKGDDFDLSKTNSEGVHLLKGYLDFAEKGRVALLHEITKEEPSESPFEDSVYDLLTAKGVKVKKQVGCSGYRIDLAILDEDLPGKYILGIECDGAYYHSSSTARDRDRLRQQVLENLDWNIYRIWSTDWFKNPRKELEKLLRVIQKVKGGEFSKKKLKSNSKYKIQYKNNINKINPQVKDYQITPIQSESYSDNFYRANSSEISSILKKVVDCEGPIYRDEAWKRVVQHWDIRSVGSRIRQMLQSVENYAISKKIIQKKGKFYWPSDMATPNVRFRDNEGKNIELISPEEIGEAAIVVLRKECSMPNEDLINQTARILGFKRVTDAMHAYINESIDKYIKADKIIVVNKRLTISDEEDILESPIIKGKEIISTEATDGIEVVSEKQKKNTHKVKNGNLLEQLDTMIVEAVSKKHTITIDYNSPSKGKSTRKIQPYQYDGVYIKAHCHLVNDDRTFRIDRIERIY